MQTIILERFAYSPDGTFGRLMLPDGWSCFTVEQPWNGNLNSQSCIPDGVYDLRRRRSPVVQRTSGGDYVEGCIGRTLTLEDASKVACSI